MLRRGALVGAMQRAGWHRAAPSSSTQMRRLNTHGETALPDVIGFHETVADVIRATQKHTRPLTTKMLYDFSDEATEAKLLKSAQFLHRELPIRVAKRLIDFQQLPFIIGCNPHLRKVYDLYSEAFVSLSAHPPLLSEADQKPYTEQLRAYLDDHMNVITLLACGVKESKRVLGSKEAVPLNGFLDRTITSRIGLRLLIENQIALDEQAHRADDSGYAGVICRRLSPTSVIQKMTEITQRMCRNRYGVSPSVQLHGQTNAVFSYIPTHLEYILQELFKNAFRATVEEHEQSGTIPDVDITICQNDNFLILRISDQGGGIAPDMVDNCWKWSFTTVDQESNGPPGGSIFNVLSESEPDGPLAGLGFGMPMTKLYLEYFGGSLEVVPMFGYGTDVYVTLKDLNSKSAASTGLPS
mmetsp:Transcript_23989/g.71573  ORF Transcript_23989/g.71573 Transcript_23989/m.71573 type:complete len:412 (-) Transcript_23989:2300-3535(-)